MNAPSRPDPADEDEGALAASRRPEPPQASAARAEHDALARRLEVRASIDEAKRGLLRLFVGLIAAGVAVRLAWDRYGTLKPGAVRIVRGPPLFLWIATGVSVALLALAVRALLRSRRLAREEDRLFARYRALRAELELDG
jgi:hypothetical protein